jgi:hypothetical protein
VPGLAEFNARDVGRVVCERYPFMQAPAANVLHAAHLDRLGHIGAPEGLLSSRLQAVEAEALTWALRRLREAHGVLALPMHDGLLVPRSAVSAATAALVEGFARVGVLVRTDVTPAGQG